MKREVKIGVFAVVMILAAWAGIRFLKGFDIFSRNNEYYAAYDQINGVQNASPIMMKGVKIGSVTGISFDPSESENVILHFTINRKYNIPIDSEAKIFSNGLMGAKAIEIIYGQSERYLAAGDTLRSGRDRDLMDMAGSELDYFKQLASQITSDLSRTMNNLNGLMEANAQNINGTMANVNAITRKVDDMLATEKERLQQAIEGFSQFATMMGEKSETVDSILTNLNQVTTQLSQQDVAQKAATAIDNLNQVLAAIEDGRGTAGKLLYDPTLYHNLSTATQQVALLMEDLRKYPARYVHLSVFGRNPEKMKAKADRKAAKEAEKARRDSLRQANN